MKRNSKDNLMEYLVELAENEVPITYESLINTLYVFEKTTVYYRDDYELKKGIYGGWIAASIDSFFTLITFIPYNREIKEIETINNDDEVIIIRIIIENKDMRYKNNKYCKRP